MAEYIHRRNHILNLAISQLCMENQSIIKIMDNLTSVFIFLFFFFENSPKRQKFLECFLEFYKDDLNLPKTKQQETIGPKLTINIICYTKQQLSILSQSKKETYMMSFKNRGKVQRKLDLRCRN